MLFIKSLKYEPSKSSAELECWLRSKGVQRFDVEIKLDLTESVSGTPTWTALFECQSDSDTLSVTGSTIDSNPAFYGGSSMTCTVSKTSNGGIAQGNGTINWIINGVTKHTVNFLNGANVSSNAYTFTGVAMGDIVRTEIFEG